MCVNLDTEGGYDHAMRRVGGSLIARLIVFSPLGAVGLGIILGMQIFAWVFLPLVDLKELFPGGPAVHAEGVVTAVEATSSTVNKRRVFEVKFRLDDGTTASSYGTNVSLSPGARVPVEHPPGDPAAANIVGLRRSAFPAWAVLPMMFPLVGGIVLFAVAVFLGMRNIRTLRNGEPASARVISSERTNTRVNRQYIYRIKVGFSTPSRGNVESVVRSRDPRHRIPDATLRVIHDAGTGRTLLPEALPGRPEIVGEEVVASGGSSVMAVLFVAAAVGGWVVLYAIKA